MTQYGPLYVWEACPKCGATEGAPCTDLRYSTEAWPLADNTVHDGRPVRQTNAPPRASTTPTTPPPASNPREAT